MVEEFLNVVILVLGERHTPGVGQVSQLESIRKDRAVGLISGGTEAKVKFPEGVRVRVEPRVHVELRQADLSHVPGGGVVLGSFLSLPHRFSVLI